MGTKRLGTFCGLLSGLVISALGSSDAQAQLTQSFSDQSVNQAYYQPLTQKQYRKHVQASYQDDVTTYRDLQTQHFGATQTALNGPFDASQEPRRASPSIQQRASRLLRSQQSISNSSSFPAENSSNNVGFRRLQQDDPFGENQKQNAQPIENNKLDPFADPPTEQSNTTQDPFGESQVQPNVDPQVTPPVESSVLEPTTNPFADPPMQNPVLPDDGQFNPNPNQQLPKPELTAPRIQPSDLEEMDLPPGTIIPGDIDSSNPTGQDTTPTDPFVDPPQQLDAGMQYIQDEPLKKQSERPSNVYRQPGANMPPIVRPDQTVPYQTAPYQSSPSQTQPRMVRPPMAEPQFVQPPGYSPAYQPIPGLPAQPQYAQPAQVPMHTDYYEAPSMPADNVYSNVVADPTDSGCQSCASGCVSSCDSCCPNFYFSFFGGYTNLSDPGPLPGANSQLSTDSGSGFGVALGRRNGRNLRTEAEFSYRQNNFNGILALPNQNPAPFTGELNSYAGMANAYWEFIDVPTRCFKPYIGVGVGFVSIDTEVRDATGQNIVPPGAENDSSLAYQWIAGVNYKAYRNVDLFAEYRFFKADSFTIDPSVTGFGNRYDYETDNVFAGFRWKF